MARKLSPWIYWAVVFLVLAIVAAVLGFGLISGITLDVAKWLIIIFVILFIVSLVQSRRRSRK